MSKSIENVFPSPGDEEDGVFVEHGGAETETGADIGGGDGDNDDNEGDGDFAGVGESM